MKPVVKFENVSKRYNLGLTRTSLPVLLAQRFIAQRNRTSSDNILWALKNIDFALEPGQSLGLIGSNGAGKTTMLKLLANITKPTSGRISINGRLSALIELGAGFHPDLTGRENIFLNGTILGLSRKEIERRFDEIVDFAELQRFIDTPIKRYSSGMAVRLGFAVASCIESEILLVDEVLAVGDAAFQQKCMQRIRSLIKNGTAIIFVSHNLYLIQAACDVGLYLRQGQVQQYGAIKDVYETYERDIHQMRTQRLEASNSFDAYNHDDGTTEGDLVEILRVEVRNEDGATHQPLPSENPAKIRIYYNAYRSLGKVNLSLFIFRSDGVMCCMMRTKLDEFQLAVEQGQGVVEVEMAPLQLVGGAYYAEAWFLDESDSKAIVSESSRSDWFTVKGKALSYNESSVFEPMTNWCHFRADRSAGSNGSATSFDRVEQLQAGDSPLNIAK